MAKKDQNKAWNRFRRYPTPVNMIAFNKARSRARKIHRQRKRESWIKYASNITCSTSSKEVWNKIRKLSGKYSASPVSMLVSNGVSINTIPDIANTLAETFAKTSSCDNYTPTFQALKCREERVKLNFFSSNEESYNSPLILLELRAALHRSGNTAAEQIQTTINNFTKWAEQNGFVFSTEKTVCVVFSRKRVVFPNPELFIGRSLIKVVNEEFKFLDRIFDQSLRFHRHLKDRKIRSAMALKHPQSISKYSLRSRPNIRLYRALIRSKLDYGSVVYSSACKSLLKILDPVHHQALRLCLGAFRTSPVESFYAEAYEPPLDLRKKYLCLNYLMKIQSMKTNTACSYLFNFSLYDFNSQRSSLTYSQPFHFRIRDLINDLNLNIGKIALYKISEVPPWKVIYPKVDFTLSR
ncbi:putative RNA-directed DNA polymerase from transposon BS [Trichonephila inaurata madagascariensis]|uniref:Putative RNA-directed DNA polymerase from transposon BS n=1 Tax=Trichonephila inaurata madagascariensis TaxID=2747483 RepID=A0A8X6YS53_9ARAC|nr:putative RNA-directed DNA polymerase from transposon BS [Trichonephila inaurata madagascariensis]